jgi:hypothetical protein
VEIFKVYVLMSFKFKVFNRYGTFDRIANKGMEDLAYAYLHYDLLDRATLPQSL